MARKSALEDLQDISLQLPSPVASSEGSDDNDGSAFSFIKFSTQNNSSLDDKEQESENICQTDFDKEKENQQVTELDNTSARDEKVDFELNMAVTSESLQPTIVKQHLIIEENKTKRKKKQRSVKPGFANIEKLIAVESHQDDDGAANMQVAFTVEANDSVHESSSNSLPQNLSGNFDFIENVKEGVCEEEDNTEIIYHIDNQEKVTSEINEPVTTEKSPIQESSNIESDGEHNKNELQTNEISAVSPEISCELSMFAESLTETEIEKSPREIVVPRFAVALANVENIIQHEDVMSVFLEKHNQCESLIEKAKNYEEEFQKFQKKFVEDWKEQLISGEEFNCRLQLLKEKQEQLELKEDYDGAIVIEKEISDLQQKAEFFPFNHILSKNKIHMLNDKLQELCDQNKDIIQAIGDTYENLVTRLPNFKEASEMESIKYTNQILKIKEQKVEVERKVSHVKLDIEHSEKNANKLLDEMNILTVDLKEKKNKLNSDRENVRFEINELKKQLAILENKEVSISTAIEKTELKLADIMQTIQPSINLSKEKEVTLKKKLTSYSSEEESLESEEKELHEKLNQLNTKKNKYLSSIENIGESVQLVKSNIENQPDLLSLIDSIGGFEILNLSPSTELLSKKENLKVSKTELEALILKKSQEENQMNSLRRSLDLVETQLADLQIIKVAAVKDRNYKEAKRISETIQQHKHDGESKQKQVDIMNENIQHYEHQINELNDKIVVVEKAVKNMDQKLNSQLSENMGKVIESIEQLMKREDQENLSLIKDILDAQLLHCQAVLSSLHSKSDGHEQMFDNQDDTKIDCLENQLLDAEAREDWDRADAINKQIERLKIIQN